MRKNKFGFANEKNQMNQFIPPIQSPQYFYQPIQYDVNNPMFFSNVNYGIPYNIYNVPQLNLYPQNMFPSYPNFVCQKEIPLPENPIEHFIKENPPIKVPYTHRETSKKIMEFHIEMPKKTGLTTSSSSTSSARNNSNPSKKKKSAKCIKKLVMNSNISNELSLSITPIKMKSKLLSPRQSKKKNKIESEKNSKFTPVSQPIIAPNTPTTRSSNSNISDNIINISKSIKANIPITNVTMNYIKGNFVENKILKNPINNQQNQKIPSIKVKIKISKVKCKELKINENDDFYSTAKNFVILEKLDENLIEPIFAKISAAFKVMKEMLETPLPKKVMKKINDVERTMKELRNKRNENKENKENNKDENYIQNNLSFENYLSNDKYENKLLNYIKPSIDEIIQTENLNSSF